MTCETWSAEIYEYTKIQVHFLNKERYSLSKIKRDCSSEEVE